MHDNPALAAEFAMPDDGSGDKKVYKIVDSGNTLSTIRFSF